MRRGLRGLALLGAVLSGCGSAGAAEPPAVLIETPMFADKVASGELPPVERRIPESPSVVTFEEDGLAAGRHGGTLRTLSGRSKDIRLMVVYGYARLVGYDADLNIWPDILESIDVADGRSFTLGLRKGHKWSDGRPFTAEDFRYYWEDMATNPEVSPVGPPRQMVIDGQRPRFEVIDEVTVRYTWSVPNPFFLPALAGARPLDIFRPAHYLKRLHARYANPVDLARLVKESGQRNWVALHFRKDRMYKNDNPDLPSLQPWVIATKPPAQRFVFVRNPYYHRVDARGRQLPYIDRVAMTIASAKLVPAKAGAGEADLQARNLQFANYTFLKQGEKRKRLYGAPVAVREGLADGALPQPQHRRCGLAHPVPQRRLPPGAVARHQPARDQSGDLFRPCPRIQQHGSAQEPAVPARVRQEVGRIRYRPGEPDARRTGARRARRPGHPTGCPTGVPCKSSSRRRARTPSRPTSCS